jgi:hypothetical protein
LSQAGFDPGSHTVELTNPPACFDPIVVNCPTGLGKELDSWDDWEGPTRTMLFKNYPNPFNPSTTIRYALSEDMHVTLTVYNTLGQLVATLVDQDQQPGYREVVWNGTNDFDQKVASGIYIYRMRAQHTGGVQAGDFVETGRMMLLK